MIVTTSLDNIRKKARKAKEYAKKKGFIYIPRGKKSFSELIEIARYYGKELIIFESKGMRIISPEEKVWNERIEYYE